MERRFLSRAAFGAFACALLAACQGGGATPPPFFTGNLAPSGQLSASPSSVTFSGIGAAFAQTVTITTNVPVSSPTVDLGTCGTGAAAIVSFGPPSGSGVTFTDTVTPLKAGTCTATISSTAGGSATVTFTVNSGTVQISGRR